jgi:hypothetical protein
MTATAPSTSRPRANSVQPQLPVHPGLLQLERARDL